MIKKDWIPQWRVGCSGWALLSLPVEAGCLSGRPFRPHRNDSWLPAWRRLLPQERQARTAEQHSDNCERVLHKCWGRGRRGSVLLPELLQKCQKRRRISLFGRRVGHFLALRACVWLEKGLTKAEKEFSGVGVCVCVRAWERMCDGNK